MSTSKSTTTTTGATLTGAELLRGRLRPIDVEGVGAYFVKAPRASLALAYTSKVTGILKSGESAGESAIAEDMAELIADSVVDETGAPVLAPEQALDLPLDTYVQFSKAIGDMISETYGAARALLDAPDDPANGDGDDGDTSADTTDEGAEPGEGDGEARGSDSPSVSPRT